MNRNLKIQMKKKSRVMNGLMNILKDDIELVSGSASQFDLLCLEESVKDATDTLRMLGDTVKELEYLLYLSRRTDSRESH